MNENLNVVDARHEGIAIGERNTIQRMIRMLRSMNMSDQNIIDKLFMSYGDKNSKAEIMKMVNETK